MHKEVIKDELLTESKSVHLGVFGLSLNKIRKLNLSWRPTGRQKILFFFFSFYCFTFFSFSIFLAENS